MHKVVIINYQQLNTIYLILKNQLQTCKIKNFNITF
jgi:hypothetical protein